MTGSDSGWRLGAAHLVSGARTLAWLLVTCVLVGAALPLIASSSAPVYEAEALVVVRQLEINPRALPDYGRAVFSSAAVVASVEAGLDPEIRGVGPLVPDRLDVVVPEDSIMFVVLGRDADPNTAAQLANVGALVYIDELNRGGAGVGSFALQSEALVPGQPRADLGPPLFAAFGGLGGALVGFLLMAAFVAVRTPVIDAHDVVAAVGTVLLGTVELPSGAEAGGVRGVVPVTRRLVLASSSYVVLVSEPRFAAARQRLLLMVAFTTAKYRKVEVEGSDELRSTATEGLRVGAGGRKPSPTPRRTDPLVLVDGPEGLEFVERPNAPTSVLLVAPTGISRRRLHTLAADYRPDDLVGVVLVRIRRSAGLGPRRTQSIELRRAEQTPQGEVLEGSHDGR